MEAVEFTEGETFQINFSRRVYKSMDFDAAKVGMSFALGQDFKDHVEIFGEVIVLGD